MNTKIDPLKGPEHLCSTCMHDFATCIGEPVFGQGTHNDHVVACVEHSHRETGELTKGTAHIYATRELKVAYTTDLPPKDPSKPNTEQGLYGKFSVERFDRQDQPGCKHYGCDYLVLDLTHDPFGRDAALAYAEYCSKTHPQLSEDIKQRVLAINSQKG